MGLDTDREITLADFHAHAAIRFAARHLHRRHHPQLELFSPFTYFIERHHRVRM